MSEQMYIWAQLKNGTRQTCGYIEQKEGVSIGAKVEMLDMDGELWEITSLSDVKPRSYVMKQKNKGRDFAHSLA